MPGELEAHLAYQESWDLKGSLDKQDIRDTLANLGPLDHLDQRVKRVIQARTTELQDHQGP